MVVFDWYLQVCFIHIQPKISELLDYFTHMYNSGASYDDDDDDDDDIDDELFLWYGRPTKGI